MAVSVRLAGADDLAELPALERAAGEVFRSLNMDAVAEDEVPTVEELGRYNQAGRLIVADGLFSLTLTTYQHVPWNAPYYARLGFHLVPDIEQPPELRAVGQAEKARGLDAWPRVVMRRPIA